MNFKKKNYALSNFVWTHHARQKMKQYRLTESRVKRVIRHPERVEESIVAGLIASMQRSNGSRYSEIWAMYAVTKSKHITEDLNSQGIGFVGHNASDAPMIKIITAWRYPGESSARNPIPREILNEVKSILSTRII